MMKAVRSLPAAIEPDLKGSPKREGIDTVIDCSWPGISAARERLRQRFRIPGGSEQDMRVHMEMRRGRDLGTYRSTMIMVATLPAPDLRTS